MLRRLLLPFVWFACFAGLSVSHGAEVEFLRVWPAWHPAASFDRISEYFGGGENSGRQTVLRTQSGERAGYYFLARVKSAAAIPGAKFEVTVIRPDSPEPKTYSFSAPVAPKESVFQFGLTGTDWPGAELANPVAWKIALLDGSGQVLAERKSFLWEKPAK
jgi:hypothetical protein